MRIHELKKPEGSTKAPKRIGRGQGTGQGTTAGRGIISTLNLIGIRVRISGKRTATPIILASQMCLSRVPAMT